MNPLANLWHINATPLERHLDDASTYAVMASFTADPLAYAIAVAIARVTFAAQLPAAGV